MDLSTANVATVVSLLVAAVGAFVVVVHPETLSFSEYLDDIKFLIGGLAVGRGLASAGRN
jgi:hypothetical protein